jgi:hypothetical protein
MLLSGTWHLVGLVRTSLSEEYVTCIFRVERTHELGTTANIIDAFCDFLSCTKPQKASVIDTTMKASQKTVFFDHKYC